MIRRGRAFLDQIAPLEDASHADVTTDSVDDDGLVATVSGAKGRTD